MKYRVIYHIQYIVYLRGTLTFSFYRASKSGVSKGRCPHLTLTGGFIAVYQLTLILEEQLEGGYTITCKELPELLTECDSLDEMKDNVIDAFCAVKALYEYRQRPLPKEIQYTEDEIDETEQQLLHTVVAINEVSASHQKTEASWV